MVLSKSVLATGLSLLLVSLTSCSSGSNSPNSDGNVAAKKVRYVDWDSVPSEFNPSIEKKTFRTNAFEKVNIDAFSFDADVAVTYSAEVPADEAVIQIYRVFKNSASWGSLDPYPSGKTLSVQSVGRYACSIQVTNRQIVSLDGGCYVRIEILLPAGSEIEVYNLGELITARFIPMSNEDFLKNIDRATWSDDKFAAIENFLASYTGARKATLTAYELGKVVDEFTRSEEKFQALRRLHSLVSDRTALDSMIEESFSHFDKNEARRIVGLSTSR